MLVCFREMQGLCKQKQWIVIVNEMYEIINRFGQLIFVFCGFGGAVIFPAYFQR